MDGSTVAVTLGGVRGAYQLANADQLSHWFLNIPPERIGLNGEFDYHGLSKRVSQRLMTNADSSFGRLKVRQRGRVVVLSGYLGSPYQLGEVVKLALSVDGVDEVETDGVALAKAC